MPCPCCGSGTSCCKKLVIPAECVAAGVEYYSCDQVSDEECLSTSPTAERCTPNGNRPASSAPYFCANETYKAGAWVKVENWTVASNGVPAATQPSATAEALLNATFFVENTTCSGPRNTKTFNFTVPTSQTGCTNNRWNVLISNLNICQEDITVQVFGSGGNCFSTVGIDYLGADNRLPSPCPGLLCNCTSYGGANINGGTGTVQVYPA